MVDPNRVYMLAADHRWQWDEWCHANHVPLSRIPVAKDLALRGFLKARQQSDRVQRYGALLVDQQYGAGAVAAALAAGIEVGTPAEKGGAFPLEWGHDPFSAPLDGSFVKVLVKHRRDYPETVRQAHVDKLLVLQRWCRDHTKTFVVEVVVPRDGEPEDLFERAGRPAMIAEFVRFAYGCGVIPDFWKIEGTVAAAGARAIDAAIGEYPRCRQLILGKASSMDTIGEWFTTAKASQTAAGFAIGRTIYWDPSVAVLTGAASEGEAVDRIAATYLAVIAAWER